MPTLIKKSCYSQAHQNEPDPLLLETLLHNLKFPRCCVCDLGWFEELLENDDDDDDDHVVVQEEEYKLLMTTRCKNLIPLPRCSCTTTLLTNDIGPNNSNYKFTGDEYTHLLEEARSRKDGTHVHWWYSHIRERLVETYCYQDNFQKYNHTAMCKQCLYTFVSSSEDVIEHDYMSETQPNMKFSVGGKCPCCRRKFTARSLNSLVQSVKKKEEEGEEDHNENGCSGGGGGGGRDGRMMEQWVEHNVNTILFLKFAKQLKKILASSEATAVGGTTKNDMLSQQCTKQPSLDIMERWIHDEEEHLSDDCFSDHEMMMDGGSLAACSRSGKHQRRVGVRIIPPDEGEIRKHLLEKDPKFRQECEDLEYIQQMASTVEGRRALGMESPLKHRNVDSNTQLEQDELFARKLQSEWNGKNANYYYNNHNKKQKKSPLLKYFSKIGHGKEEAVSQTTPLGSGKRQIQDEGLYNKNQEKSSIDRSTQSSMEEPSSELHVQTVTMPCVDERTGSVSNTNDKDEILSQRSMETIVIFDSDDEEKDGRGRLLENIGHSESKKSTTSSKQESAMKCSPTTTNVDIFLHDKTLQSASAKSNTEEVIMDQSKKGHDDGSVRTQQELPQMILNNQYAKNEITARQIILNDNEVDNMIAMGFSRQECLEALQDAENNGELAVNLLLDRRNLA